MKKLNLIIAGAGNVGISLCHFLCLKPAVNIVGIVTIENDILNPSEKSTLSKLNNEVRVLKSIEEIRDVSNLDIIINTCRDPAISAQIKKDISPSTIVIESTILDLLITLGDNKETTEAELYCLLDSIQDSVLITDNNGTVKFINKVFEIKTDIPAKNILGVNILEKFPDNPVSYCIKCAQHITGQKYSFGNSDRVFSYNVNPIIVRDQLVGAIGVFSVIPDIVRLMEELQRSTLIIEGLYDKLGQINGMAELNISDVMAIDEMERVLLRQALTKFGYSVEGKKKAAKALKISLATLYNKLKKYQIK